VPAIGLRLVNTWIWLKDIITGGLDMTSSANRIGTTLTKKEPKKWHKGNKEITPKQHKKVS
jgi:hypothetical protein